MAERLDDQRLKALLDQGIDASSAFDRAENSERRQRQLEYYQGKLVDVPAKKGRSSVVSTDVSDTIGWILPGIMKVFSASDVMGTFEPTGKKDEQIAKQCSEYINHVFWKDNDGYRNLYDSTFDSLLHGDGIVKHWWDDTEEVETSEHTGQTVEQVMMLEQDEDVEILLASPGKPQIIQQPDEMGQMTDVTIETYDIKIKRTTSYGKARIIVIPNEDFMIDDKATTIDDARMCAHREETTRSELLKRGFDKSKVEAIPRHDAAASTLDDLARDVDEEQLWDEFTEPSMEKVDVYECYIRVDADGDGIAELVRAYMAGPEGARSLLDWDVWEDEMPFSAIPCTPVSHRFNSRSTADDTMEPARIKTTLLRQGLDSLYASNLPMREIEEGSVKNMDALINPQFGGLIIRKRGTAPTMPMEIPNTASDAFGGLQYVDDILEKRTGVSRQSMALDPETLQNQSATANQNAKDASYSKIDLIARNMAELGWKRVFSQLLKLTIKNQDRPRTIRLRDEWIDMDPRAWNANMDVTINVGLGTGSRDRDMAMLNQVMQIQLGMAERAQMTGFPEVALEMAQKIQKTATQITESAGIKNAADYFPEITDEMMQGAMQRIQQQQGEPSPEQQKLQMEQQKAQMQIQSVSQKHQMDMQASQMQAEVQRDKERAQMEADLQVEQARLQSNQSIEAMKSEIKAAELAQEKEIAYAKLRQDRELEILKLAQSLKPSGEGENPDQPQAELLLMLKETIDGMAAAQMAPKSVIYDDENNVIGLNTVMQ